VTVGGSDHLEAFRLDHGAERIEYRAIIIDEEDPGFVHGGGLAGACGSWRSRRANATSSVPRGFASLSLVSLGRLAARRDRDPGRDALLAVMGVVHGGVLARPQLGGRSRLAVLDKPRRSVPLEHRRPVQVSALERELFSRGINLLDYASLGHRLRWRSGDGAKRKRCTDGQRGDGFHEH
jgi:hypothetical protein